MQKAPQERYLAKTRRGSSHSWANSLFAGLPPETRVLDIGPGSGISANMLKEHGIESLYAVEIDQDAREHVAPLYKRVEADISAFRGEKFDLILLLDVLEHMTDPFSYLKVVSEHVSSEGRVLISLPNIAHWSIRLQLLFGMFHYTNRGILDKTHFQFFTRKRVFELIESVPELKLLSISSSISPAEFVVPEWISETSLFSLFCSFRMFFAQLLPGPCAYQHLVELRAS